MFGNLLAFDLSSLSEYSHYVVGCGVAVFVLVVMMSRWRKRAQLRKPHQSTQSNDDWATIRGSEPHPQRERSHQSTQSNDDWATPDASFGNRRSLIRREGAPVEISVSCTAFQNTTQQAWVVDRSTGGLRLTIDKGISPGTTMRIMAVNAPKNTEWVTLLVRSCKPIDSHFELGCEFVQTPPWSVLLLFG